MRYGSLYESAMTLEKIMGPGTTDVSEIVMLNPSLQHTPMIVSQSGKMDSDSRALSLRSATLYRRLVAKLNCLEMDRPDIRHAASIMEESRIKPERCGYGQTQESGAIPDRATVHTWTHHRWRGAILPHHVIH